MVLRGPKEASCATWAVRLRNKRPKSEKGTFGRLSRLKRIGNPSCATGGWLLESLDLAGFLQHAPGGRQSLGGDVSPKDVTLLGETHPVLAGHMQSFEKPINHRVAEQVAEGQTTLLHCCPFSDLVAEADVSQFRRPWLT